jgi:apolipoprotein N-acyltransferase
VLQVFREAAGAANVTIVAGLNRVGGAVSRNVAGVFLPDGTLLGEYDKHHMLPGPETGYKPGTAPLLFPGPGGMWGVAICKDMDFPAWSHRYAAEGAVLLAVPAWDFVADAHLHSRMAILRGVESGFAIARTAQQGALTLSDAYGRVLAEQATTGVPEAAVVAGLPPGPGATLYAWLGDWFGWTTVILLLGLLWASRRGPTSSAG